MTTKLSRITTQDKLWKYLMVLHAEDILADWENELQKRDGRPFSRDEMSIWFGRGVIEGYDLAYHLGITECEKPIRSSDMDMLNKYATEYEKGMAELRV